MLYQINLTDFNASVGAKGHSPLRGGDRRPHVGSGPPLKAGPPHPLGVPHQPAPDKREWVDMWAASSVKGTGTSVDCYEDDFEEEDDEVLDRA